MVNLTFNEKNISFSFEIYLGIFAFSGSLFTFIVANSHGNANATFQLTVNCKLIQSVIVCCIMQKINSAYRITQINRK